MARTAPNSRGIVVWLKEADKKQKQYYILKDTDRRAGKLTGFVKCNLSRLEALLELLAESLDQSDLGGEKLFGMFWKLDGTVGQDGGEPETKVLHFRKL